MKSKILFIDDEIGVLDMVSDHFSQRGYDVYTASDGDEGVRLSREHRPELVILDLKMKNLDGDLAAREIRRILPAAKIVMISAYQDELVRHRLRDMGVDEYYEKPVPILDLERIVKTATAST